MFQNNQDVFQILAEAISEGIIIVDESQKIVASNSSTESLFGYAEGELNGSTLDVLIPKN